MSPQTALAVYEENTAKYGGKIAAPAFNAPNLAIHEESNAEYGSGKHVAAAAPPMKPLEEVVPEAIFRAEVATWAKRVGVEPKEIHLRPMKRKWASCSRKGRLTFDTALLSQPAGFRAEVIVHELLHLKVPNHGRLFKVLLRTYLADVPGTESSHLF